MERGYDSGRVGPSVGTITRKIVNIVGGRTWNNHWNVDVVKMILDTCEIIFRSQNPRRRIRVQSDTEKEDSSCSDPKH